ncbi:hypothetical protein C7T87_18860 [Xanthomonas hortorum pv. hederae]|nr:hypothetical protein C7T87_18860 [Xanthomonas hortorum pv. hederae]
MMLSCGLALTSEVTSGMAVPLQIERSRSESSASDSRATCTACTMQTDPLDWSLPAHRRGTLRGMDAA